MIIVIDGPAGAGKSTTAKEVARRTESDYVDSGAVYRGFTYLFMINDFDKSRLTEALKNHDLHFDFHINNVRVTHGDKDITQTIRSAEINNRVSEVAAMPEVRDEVRRILREISGDRKRGVVLEGRDLGTVVFPDADYKFFLTAAPEARARRRFDEQTRTGADTSLEQVRENVEKRDRIDSTRDIDPLKKADDAVEIDSTYLTFEEQVARITDFVRSMRTENNS